MRASMPGFVAVVLSGGEGTRLGGVDKGSLEYAGRPLLDHALAAVAGAVRAVVVGPPAPTTTPVTFTRESPAGGGPAAGLLAGVDQLDPIPEGVELVVVLAVDMPHVTTATVGRLVAAVGGHDGAFLVDDSGRRQLAGALSLGALARVRPSPAESSGLPVHRLLADLDLADVPVLGEEGHDVDTWPDLEDGTVRDLRPGSGWTNLGA